MGHSRICNFYGELRCGTKGYTVGIKNIKEAKRWLNCDNSVNGDMGRIDSIFMIPQTAYAKRITKGFYCLKVTLDNIQYLNVNELN